MGEMASNLLLYTESWIVENAVLGWLDPWKRANWQCRGKPIWADESWQEITALVEKLSEEVHCEMHVCLRVRLLKNIVIMDQATKIKVSQVNLVWQCKSKLLLALWAQDTSGHQKRNATYM